MSCRHVLCIRRPSPSHVPSPSPYFLVKSPASCVASPESESGESRVSRGETTSGRPSSSSVDRESRVYRLRSPESPRSDERGVPGSPLCELRAILCAAGARLARVAVVLGAWRLALGQNPRSSPPCASRRHLAPGAPIPYRRKRLGHDISQPRSQLKLKLSWPCLCSSAGKNPTGSNPPSCQSHPRTQPAAPCSK